MLTDEEKRQLDHDGFLPMPEFLTAAQTRALADKFDELLGEERQRAGIEAHQEKGADRLANLVRQGKTRYWGICNFKAWEAAWALGIADGCGGPRFACVQNPYSLLNRVLEDEMLPFCREERRGVMAYSPLAVGLLTGMYRADEPPPPGSLWATARADRFAAAMGGPAAAVLDAVFKIAAEHGRPPSQVAIRWVLARPEVTTAIVGCDTAEQVDANMTGLDFELSDEQLTRLNDASADVVVPVR